MIKKSWIIGGLLVGVIGVATAHEVTFINTSPAVAHFVVYYKIARQQAGSEALQLSEEQRVKLHKTAAIQFDGEHTQTSGVIVTAIRVNHHKIVLPEHLQAWGGPQGATCAVATSHAMPVRTEALSIEFNHPPQGKLTCTQSPA